jgi:hypothetical protein
MPAGLSDTIPRHLIADRQRPRDHRSNGRPRRVEQTARVSRALARYTDSTGRDREIVARAGWLGSVLVIDCDFATRADRRLLAHLGADEPPENAVLICRDYLHDAHPDPRSCRALTEEDSLIEPLAVAHDSAKLAATPALRDSAGGTYALRLVPGRASIPELRWGHRMGGDDATAERTVCLREVVGNVEHYEPACALTEWMLALRKGDGEVSTSVLEAELVRVRESPIILNRGLREAVLIHIEKHGRSMSEIALRCGRVKRDRKGNESGETSWLARRVGLLPEGGRSAPTSWIHSDVLALIARRGLGLSPREVEVA